MTSPLQGVMDWFAARFDELMAILNPVNFIISVAQYFAAMLPEADPNLAVVVADAVAAIDTVVSFIGLADYFINLPVLLTVVSLILVAEAGFNIFRAWRIIRSAVT